MTPVVDLPPKHGSVKEFFLSDRTYDRKPFFLRYLSSGLSWDIREEFEQRVDQIRMNWSVLDSLARLTER